MVKINLKSILRFLPSVLWMAVIFYFSSRPTDVIGGTETFRTVFFKTLHLGEYALLFLLLFFALRKIFPSTLTAYLYAVSDEIHQSLIPGRNCRFSDTLIDLLGIIIGIFLLKTIYRFYLTRRKL